MMYKENMANSGRSAPSPFSIPMRLSCHCIQRIIMWANKIMSKKIIDCKFIHMKHPSARRIWYCPQGPIEGFDIRNKYYCIEGKDRTVRGKKCPYYEPIVQIDCSLPKDLFEL